MFSQISRDFEQNFRVKRCSLYAGVYSSSLKQFLSWLLFCGPNFCLGPNRKLIKPMKNNLDCPCKSFLRCPLPTSFEWTLWKRSQGLLTVTILLSFLKLNKCLQKAKALDKCECNITQHCWIQLSCMMLKEEAKWILDLDTRSFNIVEFSLLYAFGHLAEWHSGRVLLGSTISTKTGFGWNS